MRKPRRKTFIDRPVQGALLARAALYWFTCLYGMCCFIALWPMLLALMNNRGEVSSWEIFTAAGRVLLPGLIGGSLLLPLLLFDCIRLSHRFVGPLLRVRKAMNELAEGRDPGAIILRQNDYWHDLADTFNRLRQRLHEEGTLHARREEQDEEASVLY